MLFQKDVFRECMFVAVINQGYWDCDQYSHSIFSVSLNMYSGSVRMFLVLCNLVGLLYSIEVCYKWFSVLVLDAL
jgi:hypothetical protein